MLHLPVDLGEVRRAEISAMTRSRSAPSRSLKVMKDASPVVNNLGFTGLHKSGVSEERPQASCLLRRHQVQCAVLIPATSPSKVLRHGVAAHAIASLHEECMLAMRLMHHTAAD